MSCCAKILAQLRLLHQNFGAAVPPAPNYWCRKSIYVLDMNVYELLRLNFGAAAPPAPKFWCSCASCTKILVQLRLLCQNLVQLWLLHQTIGAGSRYMC